jgi:hypothetical protein
MFARSFLTLPSLVLLTLAASAHVTSVAAAADPDAARGAARDVAAVSTATPRTPATQIAEIQHRLTAVTGVIDPQAAAVEALAKSLMSVRGVEEDHAVIADVATLVAHVLARGALAPYEMERFAQGLFAASSSVTLPEPDAGLLAVEIAVLLREAGAGKDAIGETLAAIQRVQPAVKLPPSGIPERPASRRLSVLSR